jgi:hypothetical protein
LLNGVSLLLSLLRLRLLSLLLLSLLLSLHCNGLRPRLLLCTRTLC